MSITEGMCDLALEKASETGSGKITRINVVIGEFTGLVGDCIRLYFAILAKDTITEGAN